MNKFWFLALPFLAWLGLHHGGNIAPIVDNAWYSHWITYHFDYIARGVFPLWDPFQAWGWPDTTDTRFFGDLNPLYLIICLLTALHVPPFVAFNIFLVLFYLCGGMGFYLFVRCLCRRELPALLAYAMFMFSTLGIILFSQLTVLSTLIADIWFFYFLAAFLSSRVPQKRYFAGLVFSMMVIVSTYVPFLFLVSLAAVIAAVLLVRPVLFIDIFKKTAAFIRAFPVMFWTGAVAVVLACLPGLFWYLSIQNGDTIYRNERNGFGAGGVNVSLDMIDHSSLASQASIGGFFSDLDLTMNIFCYVPIFLIIILSLGLFARMDIRYRIIFVTAFLVFLFALGGVTPLHAFLYEHFFFFRMFRNLYFLGPFIFLCMTAVGVGVLQVFLEAGPETGRKRGWYIFYVVLVHMGWIIFLATQERVIWSLYATAIGSMALFLFYFLARKELLFLAGLMFVVMLQPGQMGTKFWQDPGKVNTQALESGAFAYRRPLRGEDLDAERGFGLSFKKKQDKSGFCREGYYGSRYSFILHSNIPAEELQEYVSYKFIIYDQAAYMDDGHPDWNALKGSLDAIHGGRAMAVSGPSEMLKVIDFDPDHIKIRTNFPQRKFLVFNDSYYPGWAVSVNGKIQPLYRANVAFKGVWVDPGRQDVEFRFGSAGQYIFHWGLIGLFAGWLGYVVFLFIKRK